MKTLNVSVLTTECGCVERTNMTQDRVQWRAVLNMAKNLYFPYGRWLSWPHERLSATQWGLCTKQLITGHHDPLNCHCVQLSRIVSKGIHKIIVHGIRKLLKCHLPWSERRTRGSSDSYWCGPWWCMRSEWGRRRPGRHSGCYVSRVHKPVPENDHQAKIG